MTRRASRLFFPASCEPGHAATSVPPERKSHTPTIATLYLKNRLEDWNSCHFSLSAAAVLSATFSTSAFARSPTVPAGLTRAALITRLGVPGKPGFGPELTLGMPGLVGVRPGGAPGVVPGLVVVRGPGLLASAIDPRV